MWYRTGSVTVTNGNATVTGAGTDFVSNTQIGEVFLGPDGRVYEIATVVSATQLTIIPVYQGSTAGGQAYGIQPTSSFARDLALGVGQLLTSFAAVRDGIGQGLFPDGSVASPGFRFSADQDTGLRRAGDNTLALVTGGVDRLIVGPNGRVTNAAAGSGVATHALTVASGAWRLMTYNGQDSGEDGTVKARLALMFNDGNENAAITFMRGGDGIVGQLGFNTTGVERMRIDGAGNVGIGTTAPSSTLEIRPKDGAGILSGLRLANGAGSRSWQVQAGAPGVSNDFFSITDVTRGLAPLIIDQDGNLLIGVNSGANHIIRRGVGQGERVLAVYGASTGTPSAAFNGCSGYSPNSADSAVLIGHSTATNRSIAAGGTINASGADYAEYMVKADGCATIPKGDVCGVDRDGRLVRSWADAVRYVVKSTDPNLVGGDTWAGHLDPKPEEPVYLAPMYDGPAEPIKPATIENATDGQRLLYDAALRQFGIDDASYRAAQTKHASDMAAAEAAHAAAVQAYATALTAWEVDLEAARQCVDRIAFCGQVPVNVDADTLAACEAAQSDGVAVYLVAVADGGGISVQAVREADMTLPLYMRRVGCVWAIRDGRPWIDVQHG